MQPDPTVPGVRLTRKELEVVELGKNFMNLGRTVFKFDSQSPSSQSHRDKIFNDSHLVPQKNNALFPVQKHEFHLLSTTIRFQD